MELKLNQISQSSIIQDTVYTIDSGIYIQELFQDLIEDIKKEVTSKGLELVAIEPVKVTVRQTFAPPKPEPKEEDILEYTEEIAVV